jgi:hypothetical protein
MRLERSQKCKQEFVHESRVPKVQVGVRVGIQDLISVVGSPCGNVGSWEWGRESMRGQRVLELHVRICKGVEES